MQNKRKPLQRRPLQTPASLTVDCQRKEALAHSSSSQSSAVCVVSNRSKLDKNTVPPSSSVHSTPTFFPREHAQGDRVILQMPPSILGASSNCEQDFFFFLVQDSAAWNIWPNLNLKQLVDGMRAAVSVSNDKTPKKTTQKLNKVNHLLSRKTCEPRVFPPTWIPRNNPWSRQLLWNAHSS